MRRESERELSESALTPILRQLFRSIPEITAVILVDEEGECVDLCATIEAFDARVFGAQFQIATSAVVSAIRRLGAGETSKIELLTDEACIIMRRIGVEYQLIIVGRLELDPARALLPLEEAVDALRRECAIEVPGWDPTRPPLRVSIRPSSAWSYAPISFEDNERTHTIAEVLGSWREFGRLWAGESCCFRVQLTDDTEATLVHDLHFDRWSRR